jgi:hypothetical protein
MPHNHTYADLLRLNAWIRKNSDTWYLHCTTRTVQESKLYPVPAYLTLSYFQAYYRFPELLRKIEASMAAEVAGLEEGDRVQVEYSVPAKVPYSDEQGQGHARVWKLT